MNKDDIDKIINSSILPVGPNATRVLEKIKNSDEVRFLIKKSIGCTKYYTDIITNDNRMIEDYLVYSRFHISPINTQIINKCSPNITVPHNNVIDTILNLHTNEKYKNRINKLKIGVLNFASGNKMGGGFLRDHLGQEESLCRSTGLYPVLYYCNCKFKDDLLKNHKNGGKMFSNSILYTHGIPIITNSIGEDARSNTGDEYILIDVISSPPVKYKSLLLSKSRRCGEDIMKSRIEKVIKVALGNSVNILILGGFGVWKVWKQT
jgi:uncharacterized protein (TIGR02452 family)